MKSNKLNENFAVKSKTRGQSFVQTLPSSIGLPAAALISDGAGGSRWQNRQTTVVVGGAVDWQANDNGAFFMSLTANQAFTFQNAQDGMVINLVVANTSGANITLTFPTVKSSDLELVVEAGKENVYTFFRVNGAIYASCLAGVA